MRGANWLLTCALASGTPPIPVSHSGFRCLSSPNLRTVPGSRDISRYSALIDIVDLIGVEKLLGVTQVHLPTHKYVKQVRVDVPVQLEVSEDLQRLRKRLAGLVGSVLGRQRLENIGNSHDPRLHRHLLPTEAPRVALSVHALVVAPRVLGHVAQVLGP